MKNISKKVALIIMSILLVMGMPLSVIGENIVDRDTIGIKIESPDIDKELPNNDIIHTDEDVEELLEPELMEINSSLTFSNEEPIIVKDEWYISNNGSINGLNLNKIPTNAKLKLEIPNSINGTAIQAIAVDAFHVKKFLNRPDIKIVSIDFSKAENLTTIGKYAFQGSYDGVYYGGVYSEIGEDGLKLPNNPKFTTIPDQCFYNVPFAGKLTLPEGITTLNLNAFCGHQFTEITLPSTIITIGNAAFLQSGYTPTLTTVNFPETLKDSGNLTIERNAFKYCKIEVITIPSYVTTIGESSFSMIGDADGYTGIKTVYFNSPTTASIESQSFNMDDEYGVVICPKENYKIWSEKSTFRDALTYISKVEFSDGSSILETPAPVEKLFNKSINFTKNDNNSWSPKVDGYLPKPLEGAEGWSIENNRTPIKSDFLITSDIILYPGKNTKYEYMWLGRYQQSYLGENEKDIAGMTENVDYVTSMHNNKPNYYKIEPIRWKILETSKDGKTFKMVADAVLDSKEFDTSGNSTLTWANSSIRHWLNGLDDDSGFLQKAFRTEEQLLIISKYLTVENTNDKVYLMSSGEATSTTYFPVSIDRKPTIIENTYAYNKGAIIMDSNPGHWYLRTIYSGRATMISNTQAYTYAVKSKLYYIRPMIEITITDEHKKTGEGTFVDPYVLSNKRDLTVTPENMVDYIMDAAVDENIMSNGESTLPRLVLKVEGLAEGHTLETVVENDKSLGEYIKEQYEFYKINEDGSVSTNPTTGKAGSEQTVGRYKIKEKNGASNGILSYNLVYNEAILLTRPTENSKQEGIVTTPPTETVKEPSVSVDKDTGFENSAGEAVTNTDVRLIVSELVSSFQDNYVKLTKSIENKIVENDFKKENFVAFEMALVDIANGNIYVMPSKGMKMNITLPYPEKTNMKNFSFMVLHYKEGDSSDKMFDYDIDNPVIITPNKTFVGLQFQVDALGPFSIAFKEIKEGGGETPEESSEKNDKDTAYTLSISGERGGKVVPEGKVKVDRNSSKTITITPNQGYKIEDVVVDGKSVGAVGKYEFERIKDNHKLEAYFQVIDTKAHIPYMTGYPNGSFVPEQGLTRAEAASIFANLLGGKESYGNLNFTDTDNNEWYASKVWKIVNKGIMGGYEDKSFRPNDKITRGEFMVIIANMNQLPYTENAKGFVDVEKHWSKKYVSAVLSKSWIGGYEDKTFRPDAGITRGEVTVIVNNMQGRECTINHLDKIANVKYFMDVNKTHWAYYDIVEATNYHESI